MKTMFAAVMAFGILVCSPAFASSQLTELFVANVEANSAFLDQSGKLAASHSRSKAVRSFARQEVVEAFRTAELLSGVSPVKIADASPDGDVIMTGRSVSVTPSLGTSANGRRALGADDLSNLSKLKNRLFDDALWLKQLDALSQLRADYQTYARTGDDAVLVAVAKSELPKVEARLAALSRL